MTKMSKETLNITLRITAETDPTATLVKNTEKNPALSFYLSADVSASQCYIDPKPISKGDTVTVSFRCGDCYPVINLKDACIGITMVCDLSIKDDETQEDYGYHRMEPIAENILFLQDVRDIFSKKTRLKIKLRDKTPIEEADKLERCLVSIECTDFRISDRIKITGRHDFRDDYTETTKMDAIYTRYVKFYRSHSPRHKEIAPMHIPVWRGHHIPIPACMWIRHTIGSDQIPNFVAFVDRCLQVALELNGWKRKDFLSISKAQLQQTGSTYDVKFNMCIKILCVATSIASNASDYVADLTASEDTERFKEVISHMYAGDCEDLGFLIYFVCSTLQRKDVVRDNDPEWLKIISTMCKLYVPALITGSATDPSMKRESHADPDSFICHIYAGMLPRREMCKRLNIGSKQKEFIVASMEKEMTYNKWEESLPSLVLEGTNMNCPLMNPLFSYADKSINVAKKQMKMECYREKVETSYPRLTLLSIELQQINYTCINIKEKNFNAFYHMITNIWCDLSRFGLDIFDFSAGYNTGSGHTYGVSVFNWSNPQRDPAFCFEPVIVLTREEMEICERVIEKEQPILVPRVTSSVKENRIPKFLLQLAQKHLRKNKDPTEELWVRDYVSYRINRWEKITTSIPIKQAIESMFSDTNRFFDSIEVIEHPIDENGELYIGEIRLYPSKNIG